jgi:predicted site-specific integrase-resolvase
MVTPIAHAPAQKQKRRTAGYGRVSTNEEEQQNSY